MKHRHLLATSAALALVATGLTALPAAADDDALTFAWIADIQYADIPTPEGSTRYYRDSIPKLHDAAAAINARGVDFTIHTGDMGDRFRANFDDIMPVFRTIEGPRYNVLGNHDWNEGMTTAEAVEALDMPSQYYDVAVEGWRFVFLNSSDVAVWADPDDEAATAEAQAQLDALKATGAPNAQPWNGAVGATQREWLDGVLADADAAGEKAIVVMHMPAFGENMHNVWDTPEVQAVFNAHDNLVAVFNGHDHAGRYAYEDGIHYLNQRGFVEQAYPATAWSFVTIEDRGIRVDGQGRQEDFFLPFDGPAFNTYENDSDIPVTAQIPARGEGEPGALVLSVADGSLALGNARNAGDRLRLAGTLPQVSVTDTRAAGGWTVTGQSSDLTADDARTVRAANLGWAPFVVDGAATPGLRVASTMSGGAGLAAPATLGSGAVAGAGAVAGTSVLGADVELEVPVDTKAGSYAGAVTVSLFPVD